MEKEIWKDVKNYEGLYQVSNLGRVKSLARIDYSNHSRKERILKPGTNKGYLRVNLYKNGKGKVFQVHRILAEAFLSNPYNLPQINHKQEEDKAFNFVYINEDGTVNLDKSSIEWCSAKYNVNFGTRNERIAAKTTNGKCSKPVLQIDPATDKIIKEWQSIREVERKLGFSRGDISTCCNGKLKTAYKFKWRYKT